jgi:hypothetical protein
MTTLEEMKELAGADGQDAIRGMTVGAAINDLLKGESFAIAGVALGLAIGKWVSVIDDARKQEDAIDMALAVAARLVATVSRNAK